MNWDNFETWNYWIDRLYENGDGNVDYLPLIYHSFVAYITGKLFDDEELTSSESGKLGFIYNKFIVDIYPQNPEHGYIYIQACREVQEVHNEWEDMYNTLW